MCSIKRVLSPLKCQTEASLKKPKLFNDNSTESCKNIKELMQSKSPVKSGTSEAENYDFLFEDDDFDLATCDADINKTQIKIEQLDLSKWQRCVIEDVTREKRTFDLILKVRAEAVHHDSCKENQNETMAAAKCHLQGPWSATQLQVGDVVSLQAVWDPQLEAYKVNKDNGYCVSNPDTLISGTSVVGSLFCRRKAILQDRFKGIDGNNKVMVVGSLVHELLQIVLSKRIITYKEIDSVAHELLQSQEIAKMLYESRMTHGEIVLEVMKFVPNILQFVQQYIEGQEPAMLQKDLFQGTITQIQDIEENVWVPQLGLKGKIDVSVRINPRRKSSSSVYHQLTQANQNAIPLELKTGRASFSMEHKGQLILYQMMLTAIGRETHSGLLLYLRENIMREICGARNEQRDLIVLRNDLGHYLSSPPPVLQSQAADKLADGKYIQPLLLPEPISHHSACQTCPYATICCSFVKTDPATQLHDKHPLRKVMSEVTAHLKPEDYEYFIHWVGLLALEEYEGKKSNYCRSLWTETPEVRQQKGRAIINLQLMPKVEKDGSCYLHTFELINKITEEEKVRNEMDLTLCGFSNGDYVNVSSRKRLAIAAGRVCDLNTNTISIILERNLEENYKGHSFIVDKYETQAGNAFNYTNLGLLLDATEKSAVLRSIVVQRQQPNYGKTLPKIIAKEGAAILKELNAIQRAAVLKALTTESFMLIKGLPGTGKTQTLVAVIRLLYLMGKSVIITSHTHSAVDNLLLRLKTHALPMLRLGSDARMNSQLRDCGEHEQLKACHNEADVARKYAEFQIVGVTCLGSSHAIFVHRKFDYCIVDEATQVLQPTVLRPLFFSERFILVGDPDQLPPLIRSREARNRGADESLFQRLDSNEATSILTLQYRMNRTITKLANELTYAGALKCASTEIQMASMKFSKPLAAAFQSTEKWLLRALQTHVDQAVFMLDTLDCSERSSGFANAKHNSTCAVLEQTFAEEDENSRLTSATSDVRPNTTTLNIPRRNLATKYTNYCEAAIILHMIKLLLLSGYDADRIGVIAPYRAQVELLRKLVRQYHAHHINLQHETLSSTLLNFAAIEVNTVDQYQGRDKDIIFYSCTKTGSGTHDLERSREAEILEDKRRLTVAITRSKLKLLLIGDAACLQQYSPFRKLIEHIPSFCKLQLIDGKHNFDWELLLDELSEIVNA